jgi:predicted anti-sigma-YlaC factor YlaD
MSHFKEAEISAYLDHQLSADDARALEAHIEECESCHSVYSEMRSMTRLFREAERFEPSPFLWNRIAAGLDESKASAFDWKASLVGGLRSFGWSRGVAAVALASLFFSGIAIFHNRNSHIAEQAAMIEIDQVHQRLTAQDPDKYNPFSSASSSHETDMNPFRSFRLSHTTNSTPEITRQH